MANIHKEHTYSNLDELNAILSTMDIPARHKVVDAQGHNMAWLRKHLGKRNEVGPRCQELLDMSMGELCK